MGYLAHIAEDRSSEELRIEVAIERSAGKYDVQQLTEAFRYFGLHMDNNLDDEHIIGTFQSRSLDAPSQDAQSREQLRIIGNHRKSKKILDIADDCMSTMHPKLVLRPPEPESVTDSLIALNTYEQALAFLNGDETTHDEFMPSLFTSKVRLSQIILTRHICLHLARLDR